MRRSQQQDCVISKGQWKGQGFDFLEVIRPIGIWPFSPFQKATLLLSECWHLWKALWFSQNMQETVILTFFFFFPAFQFSFFLFFLFSFFSFFFFIILTFIFHLKTLTTWYICFFFSIMSSMFFSKTLKVRSCSMQQIYMFSTRGI